MSDKVHYITLHYNRQHSTEQVYVINLALTEGFINLFEGVRRIMELITLHGNSSSLLVNVQNYLMIVLLTGISFVYYADMIYLTIDRLMLVLLNIKYSLYWNERKAFHLVAWTWVCGVALSVVVCLLTYYNDYDWEYNFYTFFYPILEILFILVAISAYVLIFREYARTRSVPGAGPQQRLSWWKIFRNSRFYISVLLILTFFLFMVVPDLTYLTVLKLRGSVPDWMGTTVWISYAISNMFDFIIYMFMDRRVRSVFVRMFRCGNVRITSPLNGSRVNRVGVRTVSTVT